MIISLLILLGLFITTYIGFRLWKHLKIIKYIASLLSFTPHERAVKLPPENSANAKKLDGRSTARKSPIGSTNNQWGMKPPLIKVSLYDRNIDFYLKEKYIWMGRLCFWNSTIYNFSRKLFYSCICCYIRNEIFNELRYIF